MPPERPDGAPPAPASGEPPGRIAVSREEELGAPHEERPAVVQAEEPAAAREEGPAGSREERPSAAPAERRSGPIAGILLAAGTSSRMGRNKLLFTLEGESVLRRAARTALAGGLSPLLVVLGHEAERAERELAGLPCQVVVNPRYEEGINSSLKSGVAAVPPEARGAMVLLADMPFVTAGMIAGLVARYRESTAPLVISDYAGVNAPPMLYDRALFGELQAMTGEGCGRQVVRRHREEAEVLPWPEAALADIDVPEDYARIAGGEGT